MESAKEQWPRRPLPLLIPNDCVGHAGDTSIPTQSTHKNKANATTNNGHGIYVTLSAAASIQLQQRRGIYERAMAAATTATDATAATTAEAFAARAAIAGDDLFAFPKAA